MHAIGSAMHAAVYATARATRKKYMTRSFHMHAPACLALFFYSFLVTAILGNHFDKVQKKTLVAFSILHATIPIGRTIFFTQSLMMSTVAQAEHHDDESMA
jgi:hypothetical protein